MPLDVFPVHGVGGMLDTLMAEMFVSTELGVFSGQGFAADINSIGEQLSVQFIGVLATVVFTAVVTWIPLKLTDAIGWATADENSEVEGLDISSHEERGYNFTN